MLRRQRAIEIVPGSKPLRRRRYDVPQHLAPETSDALRFCAVEGDLDLLDRRHRSNIEAGVFFVSPGGGGRPAPPRGRPPLAGAFCPLSPVPPWRGGPLPPRFPGRPPPGRGGWAPPGPTPPW